jgi:signal transduction histidine kinase
VRHNGAVESRLRALVEAGIAVTSELSLDAVLQRIVEIAAELTDARYAALGVIDRTGNALEQFLVTGLDEQVQQAIGDLPVGHGMLGVLIRTARPLRLRDLGEHPDSIGFPPHHPPMRSFLGVPILLRRVAYGNLYLTEKRDGEFTQQDEDVIVLLAAQAAVAIENARLYERVERDTLRRVVEAQELERARLARELHDETGQSLTSVLLGLRGVEEASGAEETREAAAAVRELVVETLQGVRKLAVELRPSALDDFGLMPALERLTQTFSAQTGVAVELETTLTSARLPGEVETVVYRIVQEALTNVTKHASASRVSVFLARKDGAVAAVIEDDGVGFEPAHAEDGGLGLLGMRERVGLMGGRFTVESRAGAGTTIAVEVPLPG